MTGIDLELSQAVCHQSLTSSRIGSNKEVTDRKDHRLFRLDSGTGILVLSESQRNAPSSLASMLSQAPFEYRYIEVAYRATYLVTVL